MKSPVHRKPDPPNTMLQKKSKNTSGQNNYQKHSLPLSLTHIRSLNQSFTKTKQDTHIPPSARLSLPTTTVFFHFISPSGGLFAGLSWNLNRLQLNTPNVPALLVWFTSHRAQAYTTWKNAHSDSYSGSVGDHRRRGHDVDSWNSSPHCVLCLSHFLWPVLPCSNRLHMLQPQKAWWCVWCCLWMADRQAGRRSVERQRHEAAVRK